MCYTKSPAAEALNITIRMYICLCMLRSQVSPCSTFAVLPHCVVQLYLRIIQTEHSTLPSSWTTHSPAPI